MKAIKNISIVLLSILAILALCFCITAFTPSAGKTAYAADTTDVTTPTTETEVTTPTNEAKIGDVEYATFAEALGKVQATETITLLKDISLDARLTITKSIVLNLNGKSITSSADFTIVINTLGIDVSIIGGVGSKIVNTSTSTSKMALYGNAANSITVDNVIIENNVIYGLYIRPNVKDVLVRNCTIKAVNWGICASNNGLLTIDNTSLSGYYGVYARGTYNKKTNTLTTPINTSLKITNNCIITDSQMCVSFEGSTGSAIIENSKLTGAANTCVDLVDLVGDVTIMNCELSSSAYTLYAKQLSGTILVDSCDVKIEGETSLSKTNNGIYIQTTDKNSKATISGCTVTIVNAPIYKPGTADEKVAETHGMFIRSLGKVTVSNTDILNAHYGIMTYGYSMKDETTGEYLRGEVLVDGCTITTNRTDYSLGISGNGNGSYEGTNIIVKDTTIVADVGIYHPQAGDIVISGGTITTKAVGIEMRGGNLTVQDGATVTVDPTTAFWHKDVSDPTDGNTSKGIAIVASQYFVPEQTYHPPINIHIKKGTTLSADRSIGQVDIKANPTAEEMVKVTITIEGGEFNGPLEVYRDLELQKDHIEVFIDGGRYSVEPPAEYVNPKKVVIPDGDMHLVTYTELELEIIRANDYVRLYAASKGIPYTEEIWSIIKNDTLASVVDVMNAKEEAVAKVDELYNALVQAKLDAITAIKNSAAAIEASEGVEAKAEVIVPTATFSAINDAMDIAQVEEFKANALKEIEDIRAFRKQVTDLGVKGDEILSAIDALNKALLGDGTEANIGKLAEIRDELIENLNTVKGEINAYTLEQLTAVKNALNEKIDTAVAELKTAIIANSEKIDTILKQLEEAFGIALDAETSKYVSSEIQAIKDAIAENSAEHGLIIEEIGRANSFLTTLGIILDEVQTTVNGIVDGILQSPAFKALATKADVEAVGTALAQFKADLLTDETGALAKLQMALEGAIASVQEIVDSNALTLGDMVGNIDHILTKVDALKNTDLSAVETALGEIKTELDNVMNEVKKVANDVIASDAFKALATQTDVENAQKAVSNLALENKDAINALKAVLNTAIANVQKTANFNANALEALGTDVSAIKTKVEELNNADFTTLEQKIADVKTSIQDAVADADTKLSAKLATLTADVATLTGRLSEVNSGLLGELNVVKEKIDGIKFDSAENLAQTLNEIKVSVDAVAENVLEAVDVEKEKEKAISRINFIINSLLLSANETEVVLLASPQASASNGLTTAQREKLHELYNDKIADLIELYFNDAIADVANATTVEEAQSASTTFKSNIDSAKLLNSLSAQSAQEVETSVDIDDLYVMVIITSVFTVCALILTLVVLVQKRKRERD